MFFFRVAEKIPLFDHLKCTAHIIYNSNKYFTVQTRVKYHFKHLREENIFFFLLFSTTNKCIQNNIYVCAWALGRF